MTRWIDSEELLLSSWKISDISSRGIEVKLDFVDPLSVSKGLEPDELFI